MTKMMKALAAGMLAVSMAACGNGGNADTNTDEKKESQEILIGISPDYPPYESKNTAGDIEGFDVDMTEWIFNWLNENGHNYTYDYVELSFDNIISSLQAGQIDLGISGFTYDPDREGIFSDSYYDSAQVIVVKNGSDIKSAADLNGKVVGAQQGATAEKAAGSIEGAEVKAVSDVKVLMETLNSDGIDAVVLDRAVAQNYAKNGDFAIVGDELMVEENVIYTTEEHKELLDQVNEAIAAFQESDAFDELTAKWFE